MTASALSLSVELLFFLHQPFNTSCTFHRFQICLRFLLLLSLVVVYQIQPFNIIELQQHSSLSNNTSVTTYVHRMIISPPCLFKHKKNDERVAMLFQCLLDHRQQKLHFCLISLLRNNVSKSVYINLRHYVFILYIIYDSSSNNNLNEQKITGTHKIRCLKLMYTVLETLYLSNAMKQKYNFCCV